MKYYRNDVIEIINGDSNLTPIGSRWIITRVWDDGMTTLGYNAFVHNHQALLYKRPFQNRMKYFRYKLIVFTITLKLKYRPFWKKKPIDMTKGYIIK